MTSSETKNQWARDDPAFVAILLVFLTVASLAYGVAFHYDSFTNILHIIFWTVSSLSRHIPEGYKEEREREDREEREKQLILWKIFVDFLLLGFAVATCGW
jgi:hypothetical protein